jgi:hypothetical protein
VIEYESYQNARVVAPDDASVADRVALDIQRP